MSKEKFQISSWRIYSTKNCQNWIKNEKIMALQSVHGQKVEKVLHPTLRNHSKNTQKILLCCSTAFRLPK